MSMYRLNLREVTYSLSEALDYVGIDDTMHGKRVAYMSCELGKKLGWDETGINEIIEIGMLHDCGVSSTDVHHHLVTELDWDNSQVHCIRGEVLLRKTDIYQSYAEMILYHHTHWDELKESIGAKVRMFANMIYMTDRIDALRVQIGANNHAEREEIRNIILKYSGTMFSSELVEVFLEASTADSFWYYMETEALNDYFTEWIEKGENVDISFPLLKNLAQMFADIVDGKSVFTSEHTYGVASLARLLCNYASIGEEETEKVILAAYFHDLGKLRVADEILYKPGPLNDEERLLMNRHGFDSNIILRKIKGFHEIAKIASMHHETLDGKGYPYHYSAQQIPMEARILAIADIFQALVQERPYRKGLNAEEAYTILETMAQDGKVDTNILALLKEHLEVCYLAALHPNVDE